MKISLLRTIIEPVVNRLGTALAAFLIGRASLDPTMAGELANALVAIVLIAADLVNAHVSRIRRDTEIRRETP